MASNENLAPATMRQIMKEIQQLTQKPPEGIKIAMPEQNISEIHATFIGPGGTPYEGGVFKMKLKLGSDFPQAPPKGYFLTKIFHPNVAENGDICVNTLKKDWAPSHGIEHVLLTIKCLLIVPNAESALNEEAGKLLLEDYEQYAERARMMTSIHAAPAAPPALKKKASSKAGSIAKKKKTLKRL
eukprot:CAMPEP_0201482338 /NCGR_PEP_ID=MMETSP0151_2-20130828/6618_1 /ASSEMBLY_ACC=CAM_ASM_000257 /TAXON_ID=200890 /ORGANISM="Paramoeba atlantica, Strain 621/1 / CCAP 1560/9" /LENGTH=184 /DNA_ID=CAMNT_0047864991 /DNA_START=120 /DNA_END=674 /DNA_ORIENTATION=-